MNPVECNGNTQDPSDDFTKCIGEFHGLQLLVSVCSAILIVNYPLTLLSYLARVPVVQTAVNTSISHASAYEVQQNSYSVGIGQEFGLTCITSSFFEVFWYRGDMMGEEELQHITHDAHNCNIVP